MSSCDNEVEKYTQRSTSSSRRNEKVYCSLSRGLKRPSSALSSSNEPKTPPKVEYCPRTPKSVSKSNRKRTPSKYRTPTKTPTESDRFIPPRGSMNFSSSHYKIMQGWTCNSMVGLTTANGEGENSNGNGCADISRTFENVMNENINRVLCENNTPRILQYQSKASTTPSKCMYSFNVYFFIML